MEALFRHVAVFLIAYLCGAFPTGYLLVKLFKGVDVRRVGSGRTGGTNVLRTAGPLAAVLTVLGDGLKGGLAILLARTIGGTPWALALTGVAVILGHNYSIFLGWKGGAGTIASIGVALFIYWPVGLGAIAVGILILVLWRYASLASITVALIVPLLYGVGILWAHLPWVLCAYAAIVGLISILELRPNIVRLLAGTERKVGQRIQFSSSSDH